MTNKEIAALTQAIATAVSQSVVATLTQLQAQKSAQSEAPKVAKSVKIPNKPALSIVPKVQAPTRSNDTEIDPNLIEITVGTGKDNRIKLPARIFDKNGSARINGTVYHGSESDHGRCKVQASAFGASSGQTIRFMRSVGSNWTATVKGAKSQAPKVTAAPARLAPKVASAPVKVQAPKVKTVDNSAAISELMKTTAQHAIAGANAGRVRKGIPEGDARRYLTSRQKKGFNMATNKLGLKLVDAIAMLNSEVFE